MLLAVAITVASPKTPVVTVLDESTAEAPLDGTLKVTVTPLTPTLAGSRRVIRKGCGKGVPTCADCVVVGLPMSRLAAPERLLNWNCAGDVIRIGDCGAARQLSGA